MEQGYLRQTRVANSLQVERAYELDRKRSSPGRNFVSDYTLPDLDWDYGALEPHISGAINELHHDKHHAAYVKGANDAVAKLEEARAKDDHSTILLNEKNLAFNLAGHVNHVVWWKILSPNGGDKPTGDLAAAIDDAFGSFDKFRAQFSAVANGIQGSGWAVLAYDPILLLDMWEHAFYLDYKNVKADYTKAFWNVINWEDVQSRYAAATSQAKGLISA
jgi:superoxide dismutase, Fe-Mn family